MSTWAGGFVMAPKFQQPFWSLQTSPLFQRVTGQHFMTRVSNQNLFFEFDALATMN